MKTITTTFLFFCLVILTISCEETRTQEDPTTVQQVDTVATTAIVEPKVDRKTEIANWKKFIDANQKTTLKVDSLGYQCEGWGGYIQHIKDNDAMRALEHLNGGQHGHEIAKYYFNEQGEIVAVYHEYGTWVGDTDELAKNTFFLQNDAIIHSTHQEAKGKASEIEAMVNAAPITEGKPEKLKELLTKYNEIAELNAATIQQHFCE